ncbi:MAG: ATP-binding protein [Leptolyngbya sp. Prado105]|jgi:signal transduction histidine kinase|nr:ATP-binding protein [Leptolyngbya sp. Prado105]
MQRFPFPLKFSIPAILLLLGGLLSGFSFWREVSHSFLRVEEDASRQTRFFADQTSGTLEYLFRTNDVEGANLVISKLSSNSALDLAILSDERDQAVLSTRYDLRNRPLNAVIAVEEMAAIQTVRGHLSGQVTLSADRQTIRAIYPVTLGSAAGELRQSRVGVLLLKYNLSDLKQRAKMDALRRSIEGSAVLTLFCFAVWLFFYKTLTQRVTRLVKASNDLAAGNLAVRTELRGSDELRQISSAFDRMANNLQELYEQSQTATRVAESQAEQLKQAFQDLQQTQTQLIQTEKMSSLGQMVAGVAHEINNPVNFIHGNLTHIETYTEDLLKLVRQYEQCNPQPDAVIQQVTNEIDLDFLREDFPKIIDSMRLGTDRIREIVLSLRNFSRLDEAEKKPVNLHDGIESTLLILQSQLKATLDLREITVIKQYAELPLVECYAGQLNQVLMNIIKNAIDALHEFDRQSGREELGAITITTQMLDMNWVRVAIKDNGPGICKLVREKIFDPFFTTKSVGEGTGLGLSISYQIVVDKHGGRLQCRSELGHGTEFWIDIPVLQARSQPAREVEILQPAYTV